MEIIYKTGLVPDVEEIIAVYKSSGINRPVEDKKRIKQMYAQSNLVLTAWHKGILVGIARSLTDCCYCCYLSDLAVKVKYQKQGIGKKLVYLCKQAVGNQTTLILISAAEAIDYYPKIGLIRTDHAFIIKRTE